MKTQDPNPRCCPFKIITYDPGYHIDDTYDCKIVVVDEYGKLWSVSISSDSLWQKEPKVQISELVL